MIIYVVVKVNHLLMILMFCNKNDLKMNLLFIVLLLVLFAYVYLCNF